MDRKSLFLVVIGVAGGVALSFLGHMFFRPERPIAPLHQKQYRVAVLSFDGISFHEKVLDGFEREVQKQELPAQITKFLASDKVTLTAMANEIIEGDYNLIVSIGALCTQVAKAVTEKRKRPMPVVFAGVVSPVKIGIVDDMHRPGGNLTGITIANDLKRLIPHLVLQIKPDIKKVLIPWCVGDNGGVVEQDVAAMRKDFEMMGISVQEVVANGSSDVIEKLRAFISLADTILIPVGSFVSQVTEGLVKISEKYEVTVVATELDALEKGPAIAWGLRCQTVGESCVPIVKDILVNGMNPASMPIIMMKEGHHIAVNPDAAKAQGLSLSPAQLFCLKNGMVFGSS